MKMLWSSLAMFICSSSFSQIQNTSNVDNRIFTAVDRQPVFPGGAAKFNDFIILNMHNFEMSTGTIVVQFIVETDGTLSHAKVLKGLCSKCDSEALRVLQNFPKWIPGEQNGKKVRVKYSMPIRY